MIFQGVGRDIVQQVLRGCSGIRLLEKIKEDNPTAIETKTFQVDTTRLLNLLGCLVWLLESKGKRFFTQ